MCAPTAIVSGIGLIGGLFDTVSGYNAQAAAVEQAKVNAEYSSAINQRNADLAEINAQDALAEGQNKQEEARRKYQASVGDLTAKYGAGNIAISSGTPLDLLADYTELGELEALDIEAKAKRTAQNYLVQAGDYDNQAQIDLNEFSYFEDQAKQNSTSSLISGAKNINSSAGTFAESIERIAKKGPGFF